MAASPAALLVLAQPATQIAWRFGHAPLDTRSRARAARRAIRSPRACNRRAESARVNPAESDSAVSLLIAQAPRLGIGTKLAYSFLRLPFSSLELTFSPARTAIWLDTLGQSLSTQASLISAAKSLDFLLGFTVGKARTHARARTYTRARSQTHRYTHTRARIRVHSRTRTRTLTRTRLSHEPSLGVGQPADALWPAEALRGGLLPDLARRVLPLRQRALSRVGASSDTPSPQMTISSDTLRPGIFVTTRPPRAQTRAVSPDAVRPHSLRPPLPQRIILRPVGRLPRAAGLPRRRRFSWLKVA